MILELYITTSLSSFLIIILILINYTSKFNTDAFRKKIFLALLCTALIAIVADFISRLLDGNSARAVHTLLKIGTPLFLIAQNCTYYLSAIFIDYFAHKDFRRSKKFIVVIAAFLVLYSISVIVNIPFGYYFTISPDNRYVPGRLFPLRLFLSYASILLVIVNTLFSLKYFNRSQVYSIFLFLFINGAGAAIDILFVESNLVWPCFAAAVLYMYFFVIQSDLTVDGLTGIGNRASFNEFIEKLSQQNSRLEYSIVMIDMDKFKEINDNLGHLEGDNALRDIAEIIKGCIRHTDFSARYGGDEFIIAIEAESNIQKLMDRIQDTIDQQNEKQIRPYQLYISYGYDVYATKSGVSISDFLAKIDAMMYKQKEERKNRGIPSSITGKLPNYRGKGKNV